MSKPLVIPADSLIKRSAIIDSAAEQVRSLLETHFSEIVTAAEDSFTDEETKSEPCAKVSFVIEWDALSVSPKVGVKICWSVRYKDESEAQLDPLQTKLEIMT